MVSRNSFFRKQARIHENVDQALADGPLHQRRGHRRIHSPAQRADGPPAAHLPANGFHRFRDEGSAAPIGTRAAHRENEIAQNLVAAFGVLHFGMELHRVDPPCRVLRGGKSAGARAGDLEAGRQRAHVIAMAHPDLQPPRQSHEKRRAIAQIDLRAAVLAPFRALHFAAQHVRDPLQAVADSQNRHAQRQHAGIANRRRRIVDRTGTAGKNDAGRFVGADVRQVCGAGQNRRKHLLLADAPGNELRVLPAEVQHDDAAQFTLAHGQVLFVGGFGRLRRGTGRSRHRFTFIIAPPPRSPVCWEPPRASTPARPSATARSWDRRMPARPTPLPEALHPRESCRAPAR